MHNEAPKIATLILPYYLRRDNRMYVAGIVQSLLDMGNAIRFNGNGGADSPAVIDHGMSINYIPSSSFYGITRDIPAPTEEQKLDAYKIALASFPNMKTWDQESQDLLLSSVYSIYGYNQNKSDIILIFKGNIRHHRLNQPLYKNAIKLAEDSGVKIKFIKSR